MGDWPAMTIGVILSAWLVCSGFTSPLKWLPNPASEDEGYVIEYKPEHGGWREIERRLKDATRTLQEWLITEDRPGTHCYRVRAFNAAGESAPTQRWCENN